MHPYSGGNTIKFILFRVYNRYGNLVFEGHDLINGWDGRVNGALQDVGTYVWTLEYTTSGGKRKKGSGTSVLFH